MQAQTMALMLRRNTSPTVTPTAAALTHGSIMQMKPATISKNADGRPSPSRERRAHVQIKRADEPGNAGKHQPNRKINGSDNSA